MITGHDITREIESLGVQEGMEAFAADDWCQIETFGEHEEEPCAAYLSLSESGGPVLRAYPDHPRAKEAAELLLCAYDAAKLTAADGGDHE